MCRAEDQAESADRANARTPVSYRKQNWKKIVPETSHHSSVAGFSTDFLVWAFSSIGLLIAPYMAITQPPVNIKHNSQFSTLLISSFFTVFFVHSIYCTHTHSQSQSITAILGGLCSGRKRRGRGRGPPVIALQLKEEKNKRGAKYKKRKERRANLQPLAFQTMTICVCCRPLVLFLSFYGRRFLVSLFRSSTQFVTQ